MMERTAVENRAVLFVRFFRKRRIFLDTEKSLC